MSEEKEKLYEWDFSIPVSGYENFSIVAKTFEEAIQKMLRDEYSVPPTFDDIDFDLGFNSDGLQDLEKYTCKSVVDNKGVVDEK